MRKKSEFRFWEIPSKKYDYNIDSMSKNVSVFISEIFKGNDKGIISEEYIGFKDKNGIKIYEGDIVKYYNRIGVIGFSKYKPQFVLISDGEEFSIEKFTLREIVVIGNTFENPELINQ